MYNLSFDNMSLLFLPLQKLLPFPSLFSPATKKTFLPSWLIRNFKYLCTWNGSVLSVRASRLKGNRVKIPDSPAAVKLHFQLCEKYLCHWCNNYIGKVSRGESVRRPAIIHYLLSSGVRTMVSFKFTFFKLVSFWVL